MRLSLTRVLLRGRPEQHAQPGLEVGRLARGVPPAQLDAVGEHERPRAGVQHVVGGGVHHASHQLEVHVALWKGKIRY